MSNLNRAVQLIIKNTWQTVHLFEYLETFLFLQSVSKTDEAAKCYITNRCFGLYPSNKCWEKNNKNVHYQVLCWITTTKQQSQNTDCISLSGLFFSTSFLTAFFIPLIISGHDWASHKCYWQAVRALPRHDELQMFVAWTCLTRCDSFPEIFHWNVGSFDGIEKADLSFF